MTEEVVASKLPLSPNDLNNYDNDFPLPFISLWYRQLNDNQTDFEIWRQYSNTVETIVKPDRVSWSDAAHKWIPYSETEQISRLRLPLVTKDSKIGSQLQPAAALLKGIQYLPRSKHYLPIA